MVSNVPYGEGFEPKDWFDYMRVAYRVAQASPDPSTQNGALLIDLDGDVIEVGFNEFPAGVAYTDERWERPLKYEVIEHAERNSIYAAAAAGKPTYNATMIVPWAACSDCARAIIQAGVKRVVRHHQSTVKGQGRNWDGTITTADMMLKEAGIDVVDLDVSFNDATLAIVHSGDRFLP